MKEVAFSFGKLTYKPPYMYFKLYEGIRLEASHMHEVAKGLQALSGDERVLVITDARVLLEATPEARAAAVGPEFEARIKANAVLVNNLAVRLIVNTFIWLNRPPYPTRMFSDEEQAIAWLEEVSAEMVDKP